MRKTGYTTGDPAARVALVVGLVEPELDARDGQPGVRRCPVHVEVDLAGHGMGSARNAAMVSRPGR
ncbi:hypothetical protein [Frankia sp. CiP3]|uniref:hypothetical protein n=1 Tax=Frankia sp. CiP3 TaxID=2880971 RepID=UPI001EF4A1BE|nr:hypothetical protein [Frankia sp. CiP3]